MSQPRFGSVLALVRVLSGAAPVARDSAALSHALARLRQASDPAEIERLDRMIWRMWSSAGNRAAIRALTQGLGMLAANEPAAALGALDEAIRADFAFAEAWNRRATVHYLLGRNDRSLFDIERVLVLEPRHYKALSGLGQLMLQEGEAEGALLAFEAALRINPHLERIRELALRLRRASGRDRGARWPLLS